MKDYKNSKVVEKEPILPEIISFFGFLTVLSLTFSILLLLSV